MTFPSLGRDPRQQPTQQTFEPVSPRDPAGPAGPAAPSAPSAPVVPAATTPRTARARRPLLVGGLAAALLLTGGTVAVATAHKTVTLDVDGATTQVSTFAGSVEGVLAEHDLELGPRDVVAPAPDEALASGDEVVVRRARQVVALVDGEEDHVWTTALSADEALVALASRGQDVRLMASRSGSRAEIPVQLDLEGPVDVVVDGRTEQVEDGSAGVDDVLEGLGITLGDLDRVSVHRATADGGARVTVTVQRVVAQEQPTVTEIPFESTTEETDELYVGQRRTAVEGVVGERTVVHRVILVDGQEESRVQLSDTVTRAPVTEVVRTGTKERPKPVPAPAPRASSSGSSSSPAPVASTVGGDVWAALAQCESGGNPTIVSSNGLYHGLYQFSVGTWQSVGGSGLPSQASPDEQTMRAQMLQARSGWGQWPACSRKLGLR
ncbi:transglycosylase family protein [Actinotalea sp. AC32]|nr:transglycosylase family protein [Actinotalea sp. AC32]